MTPNILSDGELGCSCQLGRGCRTSETKSRAYARPSMLYCAVRHRVLYAVGDGSELADDAYSTPAIRTFTNGTFTNGEHDICFGGSVIIL